MQTFEKLAKYHAHQFLRLIMVTNFKASLKESCFVHPFLKFILDPEAIFSVMCDPSMNEL